MTSRTQSEHSPYRLIKELATDYGRSVHIGEAPDGNRVLVKRAQDETWSRELQAQARHFTVMRHLLGDGAPYPEVLEQSEDTLVMPFFPYGSLDDLSLGDDRTLVATLTASAIHQIFLIAMVEPAAFRRTSEWRDASSGYLITQADKRMSRLRAALRSAEGRTWAGDAYTRGDGQVAGSRGEVLDEALGWITDGLLAAHAGRLGPPRLGIASHGDFGLNNVMLAQPPGPASQLVFIDTRGLWISEFPWWDPVMDLATLIAFHCRIEPTLAAVGGRTSPGVLRARARLPEVAIRDMAASDDAVRAWKAGDPYAQQRLEVNIAIRLLGNISVQLLTARSRGMERATAVLDLYLHQARHVSDMLRAASVPVA
jgi:Phosphotransferase enzyme family